MPDTAYALILEGDNLLMFHRDNKPDIPNPDAWSLPGGVIEEGEAPLEGMRRELMEEVSHIPDKLHFLGKIDKKDGYFGYLYFTYVDHKDRKYYKLGPGEGQEIKFIPCREIQSLKLAPIFRLIFDKNYEVFIDTINKKEIPQLDLNIK